MLSRWQRYLRAHPRAIDVIVALVPVFISFPGITVSVDGAPIPAPRWPGYLLTGIACAALVWARSRPRATAVVTVACATALAALGYTLSPLLLAPAMVALFFVALRTSQKTAYAYHRRRHRSPGMYRTDRQPHRGGPGPGDHRHRRMAAAARPPRHHGPAAGGLHWRPPTPALSTPREPGRKRRGTGSPTSGCGSPGNCTT